MTATGPKSGSQALAARWRGVAWMGGAVLSFLLMALSGRELSATLSTFQILCFRSVVGLVIVGTLAWHAGWRVLHTRRLGLHVGRNLAHLGGQFGWFFAIGALPLASVFAIEFTIPLWTALLAALLLRERLTAQRAGLIVLGLAGVLMILRPGAGLLQWASLAALGGAVAYALSYLATKRLAPTDAPLAILFYMTVVQLPLATAGALWTWQPPDWGQWPWILLVGLTALSAHYCIARALKLAELAAVMPVDFLRLPLVALLGWWLYGERVDALALAGMAVIVAANVLNLRAR
ncbi:DMT family transporter [Rubrivivax albus]|uniref:DMT family transporter n=2 Tax=Rubrivivax albus TaxID=2499835 RepID=A0A3S2UM95_9BURK|nr:DMT family transporter [Rubrivivax albus]